MLHRSWPLSVLLIAVSLTAGCESMEDVTANLTDAVSEVFRAQEQADDPLSKCQAEGHAVGSPEYEACVDTAVAAQCSRYGAATSGPYKECASYYDKLRLARQHYRIYSVPR